MLRVGWWAGWVGRGARCRLVIGASLGRSAGRVLQPCLALNCVRRGSGIELRFGVLSFE